MFSICWPSNSFLWYSGKQYQVFNHVFWYSAFWNGLIFLCQSLWWSTALKKRNVRKCQNSLYPANMTDYRGLQTAEGYIQWKTKTKFETKASKRASKRKRVQTTEKKVTFFPWNIPIKKKTWRIHLLGLVATWVLCVTAESARWSVA